MTKRKTADQPTTLGRPGRTQPPAPVLDPVDQSLDTPIERQIYGAIRKSMMRGLVAPELVLSGRAIAQRLGISVQPVRDALKRLEADGLVEGRPQSGFVLPEMTKSEYCETIEIRVRIEGLAGRLAASQMTPAKISHLRCLNRSFCEQSSPERMLACNFAFHFAIYTEARRKTLISLIENFWVRIGPILHHHPIESSSLDTYNNHELIIDALEACDADRVEDAIQIDLEVAAEKVLKSLP